MKWKMREPLRQIDGYENKYELIAKIRGVDNYEEFLNPSKENLHKPELFKNMDKAVKMFKEVIENKEAKIVVSYDADTDGITSGTILRRFIQNDCGLNVDYIYNERSHGHGIYEQIKEINKEKNPERFDLNERNRLIALGGDLIIIADSSSNDIGALQGLLSIGKKIIVLDHHDIEKENRTQLDEMNTSDNFTLVNHKQCGCKYPNKDLSGAGVCFKFIQAVDEEIFVGEKHRKYIDLVAVGLIGDMMDMRNLENRYIIKNGLHVHNVKNVGIVRILKGNKSDLFDLKTEDINFSVSPLLNGVARMNQIQLAIDILMTDDDAVAKKLRLQMKKLNDSRKEKQNNLIEEYEKVANFDNQIIIAMINGSSKSFNGVIAQQFLSKYKKPAMIGSIGGDGYFSGSFRSNGVDMIDILTKSKLVEYAKGHAPAGGFMVKVENIKPLMEFANKIIKTTEISLDYDLEINSDDFNDFIQPVLDFNKITGMNFPKIIVKVNNVEFMEVKTLGETKQTRKFETAHNFEMIKFRVDEDYGAELNFFDTIDVVGELSLNKFYNFKTKTTTITNQIRVEDYKLC